MNMLLHRCRFIALMLVAITANAVNMELAPGTILTVEKNIENAWIDIETTDGINFVLGDPKAANPAKSTRKPGQYQKIIYTANAPNDDSSFLRAEALYGKGQFIESIEHYKKATATARYHWQVEQSYLRAAEGLARGTDKGPEILNLLKEYIQRYPKNVHMAEVVSLRARLSLTAGDFAGAMQDYQLMTKQGALWSPTAEVDGMLGQRNVLIAQKKFPEAVALLTPYWAKLKPDENGEAFAQIALTIASDLEADGKEAEYIATLKKIYLAPLAAEVQARARLQYARLLAKGKTTENALNAFDQVAIAGLLGGDADTQLGVSKLVRELATRIQNDKSLTDEVRKEYRMYASSF
jgi:tetratricopeptide (TPR) repeat protein